MARELPQDIIENNILTRLPVKSLIRFTSVSKRWRSVILYNPKFAKSQFESSSKTHRILVSSNGSPELKSLDFESPWFGHASPFRKLHFPFEQQPAHCNFLGSSNGLVFVALDDKRFYIWNPSTRFFKQLPGIGYPSNRSAVSMYYGAGYLSATDNYKVMIAYMLDSQEEEEEEKSVEAVHVLSLKAPIWRMGNADSLGTDIFPCLQGTLSNEVLHWLYEYNYSRYDLVAFDLASEEFRIMQLPDLDDDGRSLYRCQLGVVGGGLCVASYTDVAITCDSVDFWVMREYGVRESWTKVFNLDFSNLPVQPLLERSPCGWFAMESGTVALKWTGKGIWFMRIDHKEQDKLGLYMIEGSRFAIVEYEESLIWIEEKDNVKRTGRNSSRRSRKKLKS